MLRWSIALCLTSTGLALAAAETSQPVRRADKPNIVFILADDLGYTDVGCYGSGYYETPNIDRLAAQGMRFTNGYTCGPNCQPTRAALMSGQYGPRTGVYTVGSIERFDWRSRPLRPVDNVTELPQRQYSPSPDHQAAGYVTAMFGKWHLAKTPSIIRPTRLRRGDRHDGFATIISHQPAVDVPKGPTGGLFPPTRRRISFAATGTSPSSVLAALAVHCRTSPAGADRALQG